MKWSEQMRVLQSEDEHYNQLLLDIETGELFINDELIAVLYQNITDLQLEKNKFDEIIKKYPFFNDVRFLLNCIFKYKSSDGTAYIKPNSVNKQAFSYEIKCDGINKGFIIYFDDPLIEGL